MSTRSGRQAPPPVVNANPPRPPRPAPPEQPTTGGALEPTSPAPAGATAFVTNPATNLGTNPGTTSGGGRLDLGALLHGRVDLESDRAQTGVRLPRYVNDAVRATATVSKGRLSMQDIVTNAVKRYVPAEVLRQAWLEHGGDPDVDPTQERN